MVDNGVGLPPGLNMLEPASLGLQLVDTLVSQLDGDIQIQQTAGGAQFMITFPFKESVST